MGGPLGIYLGQFQLDANSRSLSVGATALNVDANAFYSLGYSGEVQFFEHLQNKVRSVSGQGNANVSYNATSGRVTLTLNVASNVVFTHAALANICGFSNGTTQPSSATHVGNAAPRYIWRPSKAVSDVPVDANVVWQPRSATVSGRSVDGTTYTVPSGTVYDAIVQYRCLPGEEVITPGGGTIYADFQQWYQDVPAAGQPFRYVMNRLQYAGTGDFVTAVWGEEGSEQVGAFRDHTSRRYESYQGRWDVRVPMLKKI